MNPEAVIQAFKETGALLEGHFEYASGRHGNRFLQAARVLQYPETTEALCKALAETFAEEQIDLVVGPATGGIILAYETARHVGCRSAFSEKDGEGGMVVRRGFSLQPGTRVLIVEDIITTGGSVKKTIAPLRERGAEIVGVGVLIDRSAGEAHFDCPFKALATIELESFPAEDCPLCQAGIPSMDPDDIVL